ESDICWQPALVRLGRPPYSCRVSASGAQAWSGRQLRQDIVPQNRGHLRRLQETSAGLRALYRYLHNAHGAIEAEPQAAKKGPAWYNSTSVRATVTLEVLNFWPHEVWVWLRTRPPAGEWEPPTEEEEDSVDLGGCPARLRSWTKQAAQPPFGEERAWLLDCLPRGVLLRLPALSSLEIGMHRVEGQAGSDGTLLLAWSMGAWPQAAGSKSQVPPLPPCARNIFIESSCVSEEVLSARGEEEEEEGESSELLPPELRAAAAAAGVVEVGSWLQGVKISADASCGGFCFGPALCSGSVELDLSPWL
ncbi:unnamed protein product, partial [Polarella glacialis]